MDQDKKELPEKKVEAFRNYPMDKDFISISLNLPDFANLCGNLSGKTLRDLGLTIIDLGVIIYLAFFGFADKKIGSLDRLQVKAGERQGAWFSRAFFMMKN
jgi:hypothetical protein